MQVYEVRFMRGDTFYVEAETEAEAYRIVKKEHPETTSYDVLDIQVVSN